MLNMTSGRPARLLYQSGSYRVVAQGDHVICAVTGKKIPLNSLRYWSHELQEAYADPISATQRYAEARAQGKL